MMFVSSILHASESLEIRADVEKNLYLALRIIQGTRQIVEEACIIIWNHL